METVAVYCESTLKTYGFREVTGLSLLTWVMGANEVGSLGFPFQQLGKSDGQFRMVVIRASGHGRLKLHLLVDGEKQAAVTDQLRGIMDRGPNPDDTLHGTSPVEMLFFHGPHYQDRYGIADRVFSALARESVPVIVSACSASSIYIVFPHQKARDAVSVLSRVIDIPREVNSGAKALRKTNPHDGS